jgi:hypothetical protein
MANSDLDKEMDEQLSEEKASPSKFFAERFLLLSVCFICPSKTILRCQSIRMLFSQCSCQLDRRGKNRHVFETSKISRGTTLRR